MCKLECLIIIITKYKKLGKNGNLLNPCGVIIFLLVDVTLKVPLILIEVNIRNYLVKYLHDFKIIIIIDTVYNC